MKSIITTLFIIFSLNPAFAETKMEIGLDVYNNKAMCGTCHTLQAAGSEGDIGPNLDQLKPSIDQIVYAVSNGIGVMPSWEGILSKEEIEAVAFYVFSSTNK
jgi:mono/diheme cytochrome c family protein